MKIASLLFLIVVFVSVKMNAQSPNEIAETWENEHISKIFPSDVRHADLKKYLDVLREDGIKVEEVGRSNANREIYQMEIGTGPIKVFLWSQMHGDEPTATSALIDLFHYMKTHPEVEWVKRAEKELTIRAVPMLNPDGAEAYTRRNLQGIDINRDAVDLKTPEGRLLKQLRADWNPSIGFNLHNQQSLTLAGARGEQASISLLVVYGDAAKTDTDGLVRNKRIASAIVNALRPFIAGHIARYDDGYTSTAFGDNFSAWGTPVILIETGALVGKDEMYLVKMNFVAFVTAINSLASGSEKNESIAPYMNLPHNASGGVTHFVFRNVTTFNGTAAQPPVDVAAVQERRRASYFQTIKITSVGKLRGIRGLEEYDATGFTVYQRNQKFRPGDLVEFYFYKGVKVLDRNVPNFEKDDPPDAIFAGGKWVKGEGIVKKIR